MILTNFALILVFFNVNTPPPNAQINEHENMKKIFYCALLYGIATLSFYYGLNATKYRFVHVFEQFRADFGPCVSQDFLYMAFKVEGGGSASSTFSCKIALTFFNGEKSADLGCW